MRQYKRASPTGELQKQLNGIRDHFQAQGG